MAAGMAHAVKGEWAAAVDLLTEARRRFDDAAFRELLPIDAAEVLYLCAIGRSGRGDGAAGDWRSLRPPRCGWQSPRYGRTGPAIGRRRTAFSCRSTSSSASVEVSRRSNTAGTDSSLRHILYSDDTITWS
jgi:hypothetical protein